jgi:hypothetical protein
MNNEITSLLNRIDEAKKIINKTVFHSCTEANEKKFLEWCGEYFQNTNIDLSDFMDLSKNADGLNFNGLFIYSLNPENEYNIYDSNIEWWENEEQKGYLFLADDDTSWYCVYMQSLEFWILDKPSGEKVKQCLSLNELLISALEITLQ